MKTETYHSPSSDVRLDEVLADYLQEAECGQRPDHAQWLARHPEFRSELEQFFAQERELESIAAPLRATANGSAGTADLPAQLGDFQIIREIGRGGMGIVYEAEQVSIGRRVALKVLPFAAILDPKALQRFRNEIRAVGTLDHPNIVHVHSVGEERSVYFYAMQLIRGQSLAEVIAAVRKKSVVSGQLSVAKKTPATDHGQLTTDQSQIETQALAALTTEYSTHPKRFFRRVAELGIQAAEALDHAHQLGIVHRDVKPSNLMLDHDGKLYVTDFGLARVGADPSMTMTGDLVGTLRYMSPEQIAGKSGVLDHRTDVYSLGVTLYELLALRPAFAGESREALLQQITESTPQTLGKSNPATPADLETIVHKAIEKDADDRYASAAELAEDLHRYLAAKPIRARRPSIAQRGRKWVRRHPSLVVAAVLALTVSLAASLLAVGVAGSEQEKASQALSEKSDALEQAGENLKLAQRQRDRARANLHQAIKTVDRMYVAFVKSWLASNTHMSAVQISYMNEALEFYQALTADLAGDPAERSLLGVAYERIGDIQHYLYDYAAAAEAWQLAVTMSETKLALEPQHLAERQHLVRRYAGLGASLEKLGRLSDADEVYRRGVTHVEGLARDFPNEKDYQFEAARYQLRRAALLCERDQADEAEVLALAAREVLPGLNQSVPRPEFELLSLQSGRVLARIYWQQERLPEARKLIDGAVQQCRKLRSYEYSDLRPLLLEEVELTVFLGDLAWAANELETAATAYRTALGLKLQSLRARLEPAVFEYASLFNKEDVSWDAAWEPITFIEYIEIAQRLAIACRQLGRPYEAEMLLGDCLLEAAVIDDIDQGVLRYGIAQANSAALAAQLLTRSQTDDAEKLVAEAVDEWRRILGEFPLAAAQYKSGVHGLQTDLVWFREAFPDERLEPRPPVEGQEHEYGKNAGKETVLSKHAAARIAFRGKRFEVAVRRFNTAVKSRKEGKEFDWLYLAMCHHHLGNNAEAQKWRQQAIEAMGEAPHIELVELCAEAEKVLAGAATESPGIHQSSPKADQP